jgi:speckle-type POZ protein
MAEKFKWFRSDYKLVKAKFEWNVQVPFLQISNRSTGETLKSPLFPTPEIPNRKWALEVLDKKTEIAILVSQYDSDIEIENFGQPFLVKMSILNKSGTKVLQQMFSSAQMFSWTYYMKEKFNLSKEQIIQSDCQQSDGSLTFCWKIFTHVKNESADPAVLAIDCGGGLSSQFEELFDDMSLSDVILNVRGREFPAHKLILSARSKYFAAMFKHPMKEQSTNQIKMEDIDPDVFQALLRFIYTGRVRTATMETMAANLFIAADKYLLNELKNECENYFRHHMSPDNCVVLVFHGDLVNPSEPLKKAAKFLRCFPNEVMATERWKKMKQENPVLLCEIQQFVLCLK